MFKLIKTNKYDNVVDNLLHYFYFIHQLTFVVSASAFARNIDIVYKILSATMIITFGLIILCAGYYFFRGKFSVKEIVIYAVLTIILLISLYHYRAVMVIANLFAIAAFKNTDGKRALKYYIYAIVVGIVINVIFGFITPYNGDVVQYRAFGERVRYGCGFFYTTMLAFYFTSLVMTFLLVVKNMKPVYYLIIMVLNVVIFILSDTKAAFCYVVMMLVLYFMLTKFKNKVLYNLFGIATILSYIGFFVLTYGLSAYYNPENAIMSKINGIVSGRLSLTVDALNTFGFKFFGQTVPIIFDTAYHVDSSMISMLMLNGLVVLILSIAFMTFFSYISYKTKNIPLLIALFFIAFRSSFDLGFMAMQFSPVIFLFMPTLNIFLKEQKNQ